MDLTFKEDLIGIDVADTGDKALVQQCRLDLCLALLQILPAIVCIKAVPERFGTQVMKTDVGQILDISAQRYKIEDCFRLMKTNFSSRPVYHRNKPRIIAHFMICYTALLIFRLLQKKLDLAGYHFTPNDIVETLQNMQVTDINDLFYTATYEGSQILTALNTIYPLSQLDRKYYQPKDLNKKFKKISR